MIFPKGKVEGLDAVSASFYHRAMAQYETRNPQQDDIKIQELCDTTTVCSYQTLYATMKDNREHITNKGGETQIYHSYPQEERLVHVHYSGLP